MNARETGDLPGPLEVVRRRFERWRGSHRARSRIPDVLWNAAVKLVGRYGLHRTARALSIEYYSLKKRVEEQSTVARERHGSDPTATFVELPPALAVGTCDCTLELEDATGSKMRVHLQAAALPDLVALSRSFWNPGS